jgi:hypothetical protein
MSEATQATSDAPFRPLLDVPDAWVEELAQQRHPDAFAAATPRLPQRLYLSYFDSLYGELPEEVDLRAVEQDLEDGMPPRWPGWAS